MAGTKAFTTIEASEVVVLTQSQRAGPEGIVHLPSVTIATNTNTTTAAAAVDQTVGQVLAAVMAADRLFTSS